MAGYTADLAMIRLALVLMLAALPVPAAGDTGSAVERVARDEGVQLELPSAEASSTAEADEFNPVAGYGGGPSNTAPQPSAPPRIPRAVWLTMLVVLGAIAFTWLIMTILSRARDDQPTSREEPTVPDAPAKERPDAHALAAAGRYDDAVHALLLDALHRLGESQASKQSRAMTSREIIAGARLAPAARAALQFMSGVVELSHFGARAVGAGDFDRCLEEHTTFCKATSEGS